MRPLLLLPSLPLGACAAGAPLINELMADNVTTVVDTEGDASDWIELCNPGAGTLSLEGYSLSDTPDDPRRFVFPASWVVPAHGHLLLWATGTADEATFSLPFQLASGGETVALYAESVEGAVAEVDRVTFGTQDPDVSVARSPDCGQGWVRSEAPTPGTANP